MVQDVSYYIVFSRYTNEVQPYRLVNGRYEAMDFNSDARILVPELGLSLGLWQGAFREIDKSWLRWFTLEGELIQTPEEEALEAKQETVKAKIRAEKLAEKLRQLGINQAGN